MTGQDAGDDRTWDDVTASIAEAVRSGRPAEPTEDQLRELREAIERRNAELARRTAERLGDGPQPRRFFFTHVMKTGGTSLLFALRAHFGEDAVYPGPADGDPAVDRPYTTPWHLRVAFAERGDVLRFVAGHFPHRVLELVDVPFTTITVLRDPVERTLSYLRQLQRESGEDPPPSLFELYERPEVFHPLLEDHMVKVFSLTRDEAEVGIEAPVELGPDRLATAVATIEGIDHLGLADRLTELWHQLESTYGLDLGPELRLNAAAVREAAPESLRRRIEADNALDVAFYDAAVTRYERATR